MNEKLGLYDLIQLANQNQDRSSVYQLVVRESSALSVVARLLEAGAPSNIVLMVISDIQSLYMDWLIQQNQPQS